MRDATDNFRESMLDELGYAPEAVEPGMLHRFPSTRQRDDRSGWCKLFTDGQAGAFGDIRTARSWLWTAIDHSTLTWTQLRDLEEKTYAVAHADSDVASILKKTAH